MSDKAKELRVKLVKQEAIVAHWREMEKFARQQLNAHIYEAAVLEARLKKAERGEADDEPAYEREAPAEQEDVPKDWRH